MRFEGPALCLGPDIDTDIIIAGRYLRTKDRSLWAAHAFEDLDPALAGELRGKVLVAGKNFGCGSSREQAVIALKEAGVQGVVAPSFARIFFRNAINIGLPVAECEFTCREGERIEADLGTGILNAGGHCYRMNPLSARMLEILAAGGLVEWWRGRR